MEDPNTLMSMDWVDIIVIKNLHQKETTSYNK